MGTAGKMNPRVKEMWLEALRSGRYEQGMFRLVTSPGDSFAQIANVIEKQL